MRSIVAERGHSPTLPEYCLPPPNKIGLAFFLIEFCKCVLPNSMPESCFPGLFHLVQKPGAQRFYGLTLHQKFQFKRVLFEKSLWVW